MSLLCRRCNQGESHNRGLCVQCRAVVYTKRGPGEGYSLEIGDQVADIYNDETIGLITGIAGSHVSIDQDGKPIQMATNKVYFRPSENVFLQRKRETETGSLCFNSGRFYDFEFGTPD